MWFENRLDACFEHSLYLQKQSFKLLHKTEARSIQLYIDNIDTFIGQGISSFYQK